MHASWKRIVIGIMQEPDVRWHDPALHFSQNPFLPVARYVLQGSWERLEREADA